jgi:hypothetical protein
MEFLKNNWLKKKLLLKMNIKRIWLPWWVLDQSFPTTRGNSWHASLRRYGIGSRPTSFLQWSNLTTKHNVLHLLLISTLTTQDLILPLLLQWCLLLHTKDEWNHVTYHELFHSSHLFVLCKVPKITNHFFHQRSMNCKLINLSLELFQLDLLAHFSSLQFFD